MSQSISLADASASLYNNHIGGVTQDRIEYSIRYKTIFRHSHTNLDIVKQNYAA